MDKDDKQKKIKRVLIAAGIIVVIMVGVSCWFFIHSGAAHNTIGIF